MSDSSSLWYCHECRAVDGTTVCGLCEGEFVEEGEGGDDDDEPLHRETTEPAGTHFLSGILGALAGAVRPREPPHTTSEDAVRTFTYNSGDVHARVTVGRPAAALVEAIMARNPSVGRAGSGVGFGPSTMEITGGLASDNREQASDNREQASFRGPPGGSSLWERLMLLSNPGAQAPASESAIRELPRMTFDDETLAQCRHKECPVCQEDFKVGEEVIHLPCSRLSLVGEDAHSRDNGDLETAIQTFLRRIFGEFTPSVEVADGEPTSQAGSGLNSENSIAEPPIAESPPVESPPVEPPAVSDESPASSSAQRTNERLLAEARARLRARTRHQWAGGEAENREPDDYNPELD
ncbi:uncharacterized protein L203_101092 [Cryptococcus depauperatus CBS 7841]|uniref:RING-type E3 ubiquitin transferase n=1 Tax=Cryptococcus depauperatus CBS 7841 TaxID=1295531 RepID=A0AAJ8LYJ9_9TREE